MNPPPEFPNPPTFPSPPPPPIFEKNIRLEDTQVLSALYINALWGGLCLLGFVLLRGWLRGLGGVFQRRQELQDLFMRPPRLVLGAASQVWNWVLPLLAVSDADIVRCGGFDALVLTRVLLLGLQLFTVMTVLGVGVLIPVYRRCDGLASSPAAYAALGTISVANIPPGSRVFFLPLVMTYIFVGYGCCVLYVNCLCYAQIRTAYLLCLDALPPEHTLEAGRRHQLAAEALAAALESAAEAPGGARGSSGDGAAASGAPPAMAAPLVAAAAAAGGALRPSVAALHTGSYDGQADAVGLGVGPPPPATSAAVALGAAPCGDGGDDAGGGGRGAAAPRGPGPLGERAEVAPEEGKAAGAAEAEAEVCPAPEMAQGSTWLTLTIFFNPGLRMMLDHLDWMNPLQRAAAAFGLRNLRMPYVLREEAPYAVRQYATADGMVDRDGACLAGLRRRAGGERGEGGKGGDEGGGGHGGKDRNGEGEGGGPSKGGKRDENGKSEPEAAEEKGEEDGGDGLPAVLPYWRPRDALTLSLAAATGQPHVPPPLPPPLPLPVPLLPPACRRQAQDTALRRRRGGATVVDASDVLLSSASGSSKYGSGAAGPSPAAAPRARLSDWLQPLHVGKRNVRLLQLLQVRVAAPADGAGGGGAAAACTDALRCVNARHYVVLIKRVHMKVGPSWLDRWAALSYAAVHTVRRGAVRTVGAIGNAAAYAYGGSPATSPRAAGKGTADSPAADADAATPRAASSAVPPPTPRAAAKAAAAEAAGRGLPCASEAGAYMGLMKSLAGRRVVREVMRYYSLFSDSTAGLSMFRPQESQRPAGAAAADLEAAVAGAEAEAEAEDPCLPVLDANGLAVDGVLRRLFPTTFQQLVPVTFHGKVDALVFRWDAKMLALAAAERALDEAEARAAAAAEAAAAAAAVGPGGDVEAAAPAAPRPRSGRCGRARSPAAWAAATEAAAAAAAEAVASLRAEVQALGPEIRKARAAALAAPVGTAYFALFSSSQDAQMLAQCRRVVPPQGPGALLSFDALPAPAPDDVAWPALWSTSTREQQVRRTLVFFLLVVIFLVPIGALQGVLSNLDIALCAGLAPKVKGQPRRGQSNKLYVEWFCEPKDIWTRIFKSLLVGVLPSVVGLLWGSFVMPHLLYLCSSLQRRRLSLSAMEREMQTWFFFYSLFNTFLGAVLGGGATSQLGSYLSSPTAALIRVGAALPGTANFFIQFCIARAVFTNFLRFVFPHAGSVFTALFRSLLRLCRPRSLHAAALIHMVPSARAAGFYNGILQVFMFGFAFAVVAPVILPVACFFFLTAFFSYRYAILYVYQPSYESGGRMWPVLFDQMMGFMLLLEVFSGAVLLTNRAVFPAFIMWLTLTPVLVAFWRYCRAYYMDPLHHPPLTMLAAEPPARLDPLVYMPPSLRPGAVGWYPEQGKVWEKYGIPKYY